MFTAKMTPPISDPPRSLNSSIGTRKWSENRQNYEIPNLHDQEMCFHTLSATIAPKTVENFWINFWSHWGGIPAPSTIPEIFPHLSF